MISEAVNAILSVVFCMCWVFRKDRMYALFVCLMYEEVKESGQERKQGLLLLSHLLVCLANDSKFEGDCDVVGCGVINKEIIDRLRSDQ
jgi:hypothetical protein